MNVHSCARITRAGRALLVRRVTAEHWSVAAAAEAAVVSPRTQPRAPPSASTASAVSIKSLPWSMDGAFLGVAGAG